MFLRQKQMCLISSLPTTTLFQNIYLFKINSNYTCLKNYFKNLGYKKKVPFILPLANKFSLDAMAND